MSIPFDTHVITIRDHGPDKDTVTVKRGSIGVIIWTGDNFEIQHLEIDKKTWPFSQPVKLKGAANTYYVTYRNDNPQGVTKSFHWTYAGVNTSVDPPEIENQGSP
jgi:hypothetical protein